MTALPPPRVPHVRDGFIVANVGLVRSTTAPPISISRNL